MDNPALDTRGEKASNGSLASISVNEKAKNSVNGSVVEVTANNFGMTDKVQPPASTSGNSQLDETEQEKERKRNRNPLLYCKLITSYPKTFFFITLGIHILMVVIMAVLFQAGVDIFPIVFDRIPLDIQDNKDFLRGKAWEQRDDTVNNIIERGSDDDSFQPERSEQYESVVWFYESESGNVFTQSNLRSINKTERELFWQSKYQNEYCYQPEIIEGAATNCQKPTSIISFFDGTFAAIDPIFDDPDFDNIVNVLYAAYTNDFTKKQFINMMSNSFVVTNETARCGLIKGSMAFGWPFQGYNSTEDRETEQEDKFKDYITKTFQPDIDKYFEDGVGDMNYAYTSGTLISVIITNYVFRDMALLIGSFLFIFIFMSLQTWSLWITGFAIMSIVTSFVATNLVYRMVLDYRYIGIFHVLALFIILGIGADDVFVFVDTWKETAHNKYISLAHRMSDAYRRAALAMMYTSLTTAIAFIVSATSPFMGVNTFGVFAGLLVFVNYCSVIIFFPTVIIMYHLYFERFKCCCCCPKKSVADLEKPADETHHRKNPVVRFFKGPYFNFVTHKIARWFILAFFLIKIVVFCYFASTIQVNEEQTKFLPDSTNTGKWLILNSKFGTGDFPLRVFIIFGLKEQNLDDCHRTNATCGGKTVWDNNFDMNSAQAQNDLKRLCTTIQNLPDSKVNELKIKRDEITSVPQVLCFMEDLEEFLSEEEAVDYRYPSGTTLSTPLTETNVLAMMNANDTVVQTVYNVSALPAGYDNWFEIGSDFWLYGGFSSNNTTIQERQNTFNTFSPLLGLQEQSYTISKTLPDFTFKYATRLRYAAIAVNTTLNPNTLGYPEGMPVRDSWEEFINEQLRNMTDALKGGFQTTPPDFGADFNLWHWLEVQKTLVRSAVTGIGVGIGLALPILILATMNVFVGILATLTIACITLGVVGFIPILGYKLGMLESLNLVLVVGLAVDYCVHLAEGYSRSAHKDRKGRLKDALEEVGISVLSGACTTLGASFFMLFATILFFTQFGIFMFCTIGLSILYALGLFVTVLGLIGPENNFGSLKPLFNWCCSKCKCCKSSDSADISKQTSQNI